MKTLPRVALGSVQSQVDYRPVLWALLQKLEVSGLQAQSFFSQSRFVACDGATPITGRSYRHLDSWLMDADVCRDAFAHGVRGADVAIVDGDYGGDSLNSLCQWLELPRLAVVDPVCDDPCRLPAKPGNVDGVLLLNIADRSELARQRCRLESLWGVSVLGGLVACPHLCAILQRLPDGAKPSRELCRALGESLVLYDDVEGLTRLSAAASWMPRRSPLFAPIPHMEGLTVAVAYDDAFCHYFPDTLDLLELSGANLRDFSPMADDELPANADVVFLGCGHVHRHVAALADNHCMISALRSFARSGGRIYAEGGAVGYLSHQVETDDGRRAQMSGLLPTIARYSPSEPTATPAEVTVNSDCWLAKRGDKLRGYRNQRWRVQPLTRIPTLAKEPASRLDLLRTGNVIASGIHLNLVGQPNVLASILSLPAAAHVR